MQYPAVVQPVCGSLCMVRRKYMAYALTLILMSEGISFVLRKVPLNTSKTCMTFMETGCLRSHHTIADPVISIARLPVPAVIPFGNYRIIYLVKHVPMYRLS